MYKLTSENLKKINIFCPSNELFTVQSLMKKSQKCPSRMVPKIWFQIFGRQIPMHNIHTDS